MCGPYFSPPLSLSHTHTSSVWCMAFDDWSCLANSYKICTALTSQRGDWFNLSSLPPSVNGGSIGLIKISLSHGLML